MPRQYREHRGLRRLSAHATCLQSNEGDEGVCCCLKLLCSYWTTNSVTGRLQNAGNIPLHASRSRISPPHTRKSFSFIRRTNSGSVRVLLQCKHNQHCPPFGPTQIFQKLPLEFRSVVMFLAQNYDASNLRFALFCQSANKVLITPDEKVG